MKHLCYLQSSNVSLDMFEGVPQAHLKREIDATTAVRVGQQHRSWEMTTTEDLLLALQRWYGEAEVKWVGFYS